MARAKAPGQSALLLLDVIAVLNKHRVPYAVVGAFAASFYGVVRASMDADAVVSLRSVAVNVETLMKEFQGAGFKTAYRSGDARDPIGAVLNIEDGFENRVDLLARVRGMGEDVFSRAVETRFMGRTIRMIGPEDFIAMKIFAGGPKDLSDATGVLEVSGRRIDRVLLRRLVRSYGKSALHHLESVLKQL
ncbi:MAG: nucleotidyltransferase [Candidatus Omnitrophica bacterium]|nr:nucleotidyltransferase [Candidatus Omnitrophota bacterium]